MPVATPELVIEAPLHLELYWYIAFVDDVRKVDVLRLYMELKDRLPSEVQLVGIEVDAMANSVTFKILQPSSPVPWALVAAVIAAIAALLAAFAAVVYVWILYHEATKTYYCTICQKGPFSYEEFCAHMASAHPDVWEKIKDYFKKPAPAPPIKWEYLVYGAIAVAAVVGLASLIKAIKR